jgi:hypothetical protein
MSIVEEIFQAWIPKKRFSTTTGDVAYGNTYSDFKSDSPVFFNETKLKEQVSCFWLWDSRFENPLVDIEKLAAYLPQDRRSRSDLTRISPRKYGWPEFLSFAPSTLFASPGCVS